MPASSSSPTAPVLGQLADLAKDTAEDAPGQVAVDATTSEIPRFSALCDRTERRTLKVTSVARGLAFPHAAQAIQITRRRKVKGKWSRETCYTVTSLIPTQAGPARLAAVIRGHRGIEDRPHWVRDLDFGEVRSQIRTGSGPQIMASLHNLAVTILRLAGPETSPLSCATTHASPAASLDDPQVPAGLPGHWMVRGTRSCFTSPAAPKAPQGCGCRWESPPSAFARSARRRTCPQ
jgi:predicted transposase YbfD/YdcC